MFFRNSEEVLYLVGYLACGPFMTFQMVMDNSELVTLNGTAARHGELIA